MTIQKIARLARVSIATVSRTINRVPTVDPVLARRVWRVIEKQGYYPNRHARSLVSGRSRIFGLMVPEAPNAFFSEIIQTFARLCIQHNYQVLLSAICQDARLLETAARQMIERRVDGVAILTFREQESLVEIFRDRSVSVFVIDSDRPGPLLRSVCIDYQHGIRQAVQHLAALGHNRIAFVSGPAHSKTAAVQKNAFHACMKEIGLQVAAEILLEGDHTMDAGAEAALALTSMPDRPTAVVCSNDLTAIGVIRKAFDLSLDIPGDLSVVGFDDIPFAQYMIPPLTTVQIPQKEIATVAFGALRDAAESATGPDKRPVSSIATYLVVRSSTGMAPDRLRDARRSPSRGAYGQANRYI
jgi:LacI family transcriptional regulator, galactose operon repressor